MMADTLTATETSGEILGQSTALRFLQAAIARDRVTTAYTFIGPDGVGKSLTARWFARALLCPTRAANGDLAPCDRCTACTRVNQLNHPDLLWVQPTYKHQNRLLTPAEAEAAGLKRKTPPQVRLEQIRSLAAFAARPPLEASQSVIAIAGAETLAESPANALLKTLEEPGAARIILMATSRSDLLPTLISRCQLVPFRRLSAAQMQTVLARHPELPEVPSTLLDIAAGSPGKALEAISQWQSLPTDLLEQLEAWPRSPRHALTLGRAIAQQLDLPAQLWLVAYLQHHFWHQQGSQACLTRLEIIRCHLLASAQPQLTWETYLAPLNTSVPQTQKGIPHYAK
ncbi:MAG: DNA polymerase III subunit delta' [Cyanobacteria bacterium J06639_1]